MSIFAKLRGELIDIIEWLDSSNDTLVWRFERYNNEIKHGAKLVVREGQAAVFIEQGQLADVFPPGTYTLKTENLPVLSTLQGWAHGFNSPFKAEVYFVSTRVFTDLKWGTKNPIMLRDPEFGPIRLRAFGSFTMRVSDPATFIRNVSGTDEHFTVDELSVQLRNYIVSRFADVLGESRIPALDLAANYEETAKFITERIAPSFEQYGVEMKTLLIENISLPPEVEAVLDKRSSMGILGNLQQYTQFQVAESIPHAAQNPGGLAGAGVGMGAGMMMGQQMAGAMSAPAPAAPPPLPGAEPALAVWHLSIGGAQQAGPFPLALVESKIRAGEVTRDTLVWKAGLAGWLPAGEVPDLAPAFGAIPPPLPPQS
ncbi:MAG: hypothetical protein GEEBNDBF_01294 [bacterium]|nr:hypothetical protein [bacterium]